MIKKRNLKFLNYKAFNKYCNINTETIKNDDIEREKNTILFLKPRMHLSFSKGNIKLFSQKKKKKLHLLNISSNFNKEIKKEKNNIKIFKKRNFSFENIIPKNYKISDNIDNKKRYMSKGELVEMIYGKIIKFGNKLDIDIEKNKRKI